MSGSNTVVPLRKGRPGRQADSQGGRVTLANSLIHLLRRSLDEGQVGRRDVLKLVCDTFYQPEWVRLDLAQWLADTGLTRAMGAKARPLSACPFTEADLRAADERDEVPLVVPAGLGREHLEKTFGISHWAISEANVTSEASSRDQWMLVSAANELAYLGQSCKDALAAAERSGRTGLSLEEYVLFAQRTHYLIGSFPDRANWTWLPRSTYQSSLVLCGGYPAYNDLFVNVWPWSEFQSNIGLRTAWRMAAEG